MTKLKRVNVSCMKKKLDIIKDSQARAAVEWFPLVYINQVKQP